MGMVVGMNYFIVIVQKCVEGEKVIDDQICIMNLLGKVLEDLIVLILVVGMFVILLVSSNGLLLWVLVGLIFMVGVFVVICVLKWGV